METEIKLGLYPFKSSEDRRSLVYLAIGKHLATLLDNPIFAHLKKESVYRYIMKHVSQAEKAFEIEENNRKQGKETANLHYHGEDHAVFQATYDAISASKAILARGDKMSSYISPEAQVAIVIGAANHDIGFVWQTDEDCNYAARMPIHVEKSAEAAEQAIDKLPVPRKLNKAKIKFLAKVGIHGTNFPFTEDHRQQFQSWVKDLDPRARKEAQIVRLAVQLADFGGQISRIDYPDRLKDLRHELNCCQEGLGTVIIGEDPEMEAKCEEFLKNVAKPTVGKTADAFFGRGHNIFANGWNKRL